jgi:hypothetical protein
MNESQKGAATRQPPLEEIREHLMKAQELMDAINPDSVFGARLQQLIDELNDQPQRDFPDSD